ncbi:hypothetical protein HYFRA_00008919 [Hymenoscyphus fraxineus]|uniref:Uncharacterized protein n=1 Tax=Hymenoscyphus fraxineus TaxID=746836 RepID=A0A9N9KWA8_9HELO|nr:hypothetical protein HYFRA_00008919 [Hymenoscyphus fraxineus]
MQLQSILTLVALATSVHGSYTMAICKDAAGIAVTEPTINACSYARNNDGCFDCQYIPFDGFHCESMEGKINSDKWGGFCKAAGAASGEGRNT